MYSQSAINAVFEKTESDDKKKGDGSNANQPGGAAKGKGKGNQQKNEAASDGGPTQEDLIKVSLLTSKGVNALRRYQSCGSRSSRVSFKPTRRQ